jgi:hypothetical protein
MPVPLVTHVLLIVAPALVIAGAVLVYLRGARRER